MKNQQALPLPLISKLSMIWDKLRDSITVQDSSAAIMQSIVQDILDYAQIKVGKFRKVIKRFNVRESVERVMSVQRNKANELGLEFKAIFHNI